MVDGLKGSAGDGGDQEDAVPFLECAGFAAEEADVFLIEVDVEELADLAGLVADVLGEVGVARREFGEGGGDGRSGTVDLWRAVGEETGCGRGFDRYAHQFSWVLRHFFVVAR